MSKKRVETRYTLWIGIILRVFGGEPNTRCETMSHRGGLRFDPERIARNDLVNWDADSICLTECFCDLDELKELPAKLLDGIKFEADRATEALSKIPTELFERWRTLGRHYDLFVAVQVPDSKIRIQLPSSLLKVCAKLKIPIEIYADYKA
jgi:hypothetical protein